MAEITLTINDKTVKGMQGDTVLEVCKRNGIYVPTLCHMDGLSESAACRLCIVDIEGEKRVTPSCTYPARAGLVVKTHTPKIEKYRRQILELLFTERNHFCMFCEQSGDCELQQLAYRYQMDNVRYTYLYPQEKIDTLSEFLAIDHNRCVLCGRCVRACNQAAASYTLDFGSRGGQTCVTVDANQKLNESSCTQCGACLQACPTGAIMSKISMYKGKAADCKVLPTVCPGCGVGCELNVYVKYNNIVRIESPVLSSPRGALCRTGRFALAVPNGRRITAPLIRNAQGVLEETSLDNALAVVSGKMHELKNNFGGLISPSCTNETLQAFRRLFENIGSDLVDSIDGRICRQMAGGLKINNPGEMLDLPLESILQADCILMVGGEIGQTHPIVGTLVRRAARQNRAKLIVLDPADNPFRFWSDLWLQPRAGTEDTLMGVLASGLNDQAIPLELRKVAAITGIEIDYLQAAADICRAAQRLIIICGSALTEKNATVAGAVLRLAKQFGADGRVGLIILKPFINSQGAWAAGIARRDVRTINPKGLYLLLTDDRLGAQLPVWLKVNDFLVVQTSYYSAVTEIADVVLPSPVWSEREGTYTTTDGRTVRTRPSLKCQPVSCRTMNCCKNSSM
jgi:formate dehydrogenase major subunit